MCWESLVEAPIKEILSSSAFLTFRGRQGTLSLNGLCYRPPLLRQLYGALVVRWSVLDVVVTLEQVGGCLEAKTWLWEFGQVDFVSVLKRVCQISEALGGKVVLHQHCLEWRRDAAENSLRIFSTRLILRDTMSRDFLITSAEV